MEESENRDRVLAKIERVFAGFQDVLKAGSRPTFFLPDPKDDVGEIMELRSSNSHRFLYVSQVLIKIYEALKTNTYVTITSLYDEHKEIYGNLGTMETVVKFIADMLQESPSNLHIIKKRQRFGSENKAKSTTTIRISNQKSMLSCTQEAESGRGFTLRFRCRVGKWRII